MTEQTAPFGGLAVAEPQTALLPVDSDDDGAPDNRRKLAVVGAIAGVFVLLVAAFFLMKGGNDSGAAAPVAPHIVPPAVGQTTDQAGKAATRAKPVTLPKSYKDPVGRDPFKPQYTAPAPVDNTAKSDNAGAPKDSGVVEVTSVPPATGVTTPTGQPVTGTDTPTTVDSSAPGFAPVWIALVHVKGTKTASFVVGYSNGKKTTTTAYKQVASPKDDVRTTFGGVFALLSIQDGTVTVQFGDGTPFDLAPGYGNRHYVG